MKVVWTMRSLRQLREIRNYIFDHSPQAASSVAARIDNVVYKVLAEFPKAGRAEEKSRRRIYAVPGLPYLIIYRADDRQITILSILHGARNWQRKM